MSDKISDRSLADFAVGETVTTNVDGLDGKIVGVIPETPAIPERGWDALPPFLSVDVYIPLGHHGFCYTGRSENFWLLPEEVSRRN